MDEQQVEQWEQQLSPEQQEQLRELRARKCRVEMVLVPDKAGAGTASYVRVSVTVDHVLLASARATDDLSSAFDEVYRETNQKLKLGRS